MVYIVNGRVHSGPLGEALLWLLCPWRRGRGLEVDDLKGGLRQGGNVGILSDCTEYSMLASTLHRIQCERIRRRKVGIWGIREGGIPWSVSQAIHTLPLGNGDEI